MNVPTSSLRAFAPIIVSIVLLASTVDAKPKNAYSAEGKSAVVYTTAAQGNLRLAPSASEKFSANEQPRERESTIFIDPEREFQTILGFGGALTDAAAETFAKLPPAKQNEVLTAYFDREKGIGYSLGRTNIHSCDFSSSSYTYVRDGDRELTSFSVEHDRQYRIPFIKRAIKAAGGQLTLFASPWSPPAFMKDNNNMLHGGQLKKEFYGPWARYYAKFVKAYEAEGIPIWGLTIQNEPMAVQVWESCIYTADQEKDFLKNHLGPTLKKEGLSRVKILGWDHNRDLLYQRASSLLSDPEAKKYLWGIAFHWYENWSGGDPMFDNLKLVSEAFPGTKLLFSEGTVEKFDIKRVGDWALGEKYGLHMIRDFNNGSVGFTDWNILLDERGGPNHVGNFCFAPIHGNTKTGELIYTNEYYYIGHFSKFVRPGARRIIASSTRSQLPATAFRNPDGSIAVVVMNPTESAAKYSVWLNGQALNVNAPAHSIQTVVF